MSYTTIIFPLILVLAILPSPVLAQTNQMNPSEKLSPSQKAILRIEGEFFEAIKSKDTKTLGRLIADDFAYRSPRQPDSGKDDFLKAISSMPIKIVALWGEEMKINVYGEIAVLTGLQMAKTLNDDGKEETSAVMFTDVFQKRRGRWVLTLAYATDLPQTQGQSPSKK